MATETRLFLASFLSSHCVHAHSRQGKRSTCRFISCQVTFQSIKHLWPNLTAESSEILSSNTFETSRQMDRGQSLIMLRKPPKDLLNIPSAVKGSCHSCLPRTEEISWGNRVVWLLLLSEQSTQLHSRALREEEGGKQIFLSYPLDKSDPKTETNKTEQAHQLMLQCSSEETSLPSYVTFRRVILDSSFARSKTSGCRGLRDSVERSFSVTAEVLPLKKGT